MHQPVLCPFEWIDTGQNYLKQYLNPVKIARIRGKGVPRIVQCHTTLNLGPPPTAYKVIMAKFAESTSRTAYKATPLKSAWSSYDPR